MNEQKETLGTFPFIIGGMSFIPMIGVPFGLIAIVWGLFTRKAGGKKLALVGGSGIIVTILLYSVLFYVGFVRPSEAVDDARKKLSESTITSLAHAIEFYKIENGHFPESLEVLKEAQTGNPLLFIVDPADVTLGKAPRNYYYQLIDSDHYYLLGVGLDGLPFTADDILPTIEGGPQSKVGLVIKER